MLFFDIDDNLLVGSANNVDFFCTTSGLPMANSKPSRRGFVGTDKCSSPRPDTLNFSRTRRVRRAAPHVDQFLIGRSLMLREVTNTANHAAKGVVSWVMLTVARLRPMRAGLDRLWITQGVGYVEAINAKCRLCRQRSLFDIDSVKAVEAFHLLDATLADFVTVDQLNVVQGFKCAAVMRPTPMTPTKLS